MVKESKAKTPKTSGPSKDKKSSKAKRPDKVRKSIPEVKKTKAEKSLKSIKGDKPNKAGKAKETLPKGRPSKTGKEGKNIGKVPVESPIPIEVGGTKPDEILEETEKVGDVPAESDGIRKFGVDEVNVDENLLEEDEEEEDHEDEFEDDLSRFDDLYMKIESDTSSQHEGGFEEEEKGSSLGSDYSDHSEKISSIDKEKRIDVLKSNFLDVVAQLPKVSEIPMDESIERFIKRLEGDVTEESEEEVVVEEEIPKAEEGSVTSTSTEVGESEEVSMEFEFESSSEEETFAAAETKTYEDNLFEALIQLEEKPVVTEIIDYELLERLQEMKQLKEDTRAFLDDLVDCVVDEAEYVDPKILLRKSLHKVKLFKKFSDLMCAMLSERKVKTFLERKVVEYYRRQKKTFWPITPEGPDVLEEEYGKFKVAINNLNDALGREETMSKIAKSKMEIVEMQEAEKREELDALVNQLHSMIRKTFANRKSERFDILVNRQIREMSSLQREISEVRNKLIHLQHIMANLMEKREKLENLGPNLHLRNYEVLVLETFNLGKKIEERNEDLEKFRNRFSKHTNVLAHVKEKKRLLRLELEYKRSILDSVLCDEQGFRSYIHDMRRSRLEVKRRIQELSFQNGLTDKPALCIDYDETLEKFLAYQEVVKKLKVDLQTLEKKIEHYSKCPSKQDLRFSVNSFKEEKEV